jgi:hypothetical protein
VLDVESLPPFSNERAGSTRCGARYQIRVHFDRRCATVRSPCIFFLVEVRARHVDGVDLTGLWVRVNGTSLGRFMPLRTFGV